jgi:hypothetical protein
MRQVYHPGVMVGGTGRERTPEEIQKAAAEIIRRLEAESANDPPGPGLRCPVCGGQLAHERLNGYHCIRGCQR